jgi:hypothetical protein
VFLELLGPPLVGLGLAVKRASDRVDRLWRLTLLFVAASPFVVRSLLAAGIEPAFEPRRTLLAALLSIAVVPVLRRVGLGFGDDCRLLRLWAAELVAHARNESGGSLDEAWTRVRARLQTLGFESRSMDAPERVVFYKGHGSRLPGLLGHAFVGFITVRSDGAGVAIDVELRMVDSLFVVWREERELSALAEFLCLRTERIERVEGSSITLEAGWALALVVTLLGLLAPWSPARLMPWINASAWAALGALGLASFALLVTRAGAVKLRFAFASIYLAHLPLIARLLRQWTGM